MRTLITNTLVAGLLGTAAASHAENWVPITGSERLQNLVGGATVQVQTKPGRVGTGTYNKDGTAVLKIGGATFPRIWEVKGEDQVCYRSTIEDVTIDCYRFEQDADDPAHIRLTHVDGKVVYTVRVLNEETRQVAAEMLGGDAGSFSTPSAAEVAAQISNPNSTIGKLNFYLDYMTYQGDIPGADDTDSLRLIFQPSLPKRFGKRANFFFRPTVPLLISQEVYAGDANDPSNWDRKTWEFGDISYDLAVFNSTEFGLIYGGGVAGTIPTATDKAFAGDQWLLGPELILALGRRWGAVGIIANTQWDFAGDDDKDTHVTTGQYFYSFNLGNGWVFGGNPIFSYNHKAASDNRLRLPVAIGAAKTLIMGGKAVEFGLQYWYYVATPDNVGPQHQIRIQIIPLVKLPW